METTMLANTQPNPVPDGSQPGFNDSLPEVPPAVPPSSLQSPASSLSFPRCPGETPRAFSAFMTWFKLGHARSLAAVADKLGESPGTVKNWSSKHGWAERLQTYQAGLLQEQARHHTAFHLQQAADWNRRLVDLREQEWEAAQKLNAVAQCFLETCGEDDVRRMTLAQVSRAVKISSAVARSAITGAELPPSSETELSPLQQQLLAGLTRIYGSSAASAPAPITHPEFESSNAK
jgi:hypothetical protein